MPYAEQFRLEDPRWSRAVFGLRDEGLRAVEETFTVDVSVRGEEVRLEGDPQDVALARRLMEDLYQLAATGQTLSTEDVVRAAAMVREDPASSPAQLFREAITIGAGRKSVSPKSLRQRSYVEMMRAQDLVFGLGPAGTGKTYLAVAMAVSCLLNRSIKRIVLTRPAVEAGEKLGFLPGDLREKVSPYLRPLYDALHDMLDFERTAQLTERGVIEIAPLAFMRGRTLNDSFVILDEAQNATREQMKMLLTRLGYGTKAVVIGDTTQVDLQRKSDSGLAHAVRLLEEVEGVSVVRFTDQDVVRHPLVRRVIQAYEADEARQREVEDARQREADERRSRANALRGLDHDRADEP